MFDEIIVESGDVARNDAQLEKGQESTVEVQQPAYCHHCHHCHHCHNCHRG